MRRRLPLLLLQQQQPCSLAAKSAAAFAGGQQQQQWRSLASSKHWQSLAAEEQDGQRDSQQGSQLPWLISNNEALRSMLGRQPIYLLPQQQPNTALLRLARSGFSSSLSSSSSSTTITRQDAFLRMLSVSAESACTHAPAACVHACTQACPHTRTCCRCLPNQPPEPALPADRSHQEPTQRTQGRPARGRAA